MYEHLLDKYWVFFEGLPNPVFYGRFYPMGDKDGPYRQLLWDDFNYGRGLKRDKDPEGKYLSIWGDAYENDLRTLLNNVYFDTKGMRRGVAVIPSSTQGSVNRLTELVRRLLAEKPDIYADLTYSVTRSKTKEKAHIGGKRSYAKCFDTIAVAHGAKVEQLEVILVLDDILTSGMSFRAMNDRLRAAGFNGTIINFAFLRTFPSEGASLLMEWRHENRKTVGMRNHMAMKNAERPIGALVFDLDQTLLDDSLRSIKYEEGLSLAHDRMPYLPYKGIRELIELCIPFAIVSNRPGSQLARLMLEPALSDAVYPYLNSEPVENGGKRLRDLSRTYAGEPQSSWRSPHTPRNVFSFPVEDRGSYKIRYYKPSPRGVSRALDYLRSQFLGNRRGARIIGLGNTTEDIVAYKAAGIESALALWGVPDGLKDYARREWSADYVFDTVGAFCDWVKSTTRYHEMAVAAEASNPNNARELFELAIKYGDNIGDSAFRLARMLHEIDPARAERLYVMAIEAGNEDAATNNLGVLVQNNNPSRAMALFNRAIAAGNERNATRNLARLIWRSDPARAVLLLERAALAGNSAKLAKDLEPLILDGREDAIRLYERLIVTKDGRLANNLANLIRDRNPKGAIRLYEQAINAGEELYATYSLGVMLMNDQPGRSKELFKRAIAAGNERGATNALGCILLNENTDRARTLFERSVAAGDRKFAPVNLSRMLRDEDPTRALELLRMAIRAGRKDLTDDLESLVRKNVPGAIILYESAVVSEDETKANNLAESIKGFAPKRARHLYQRAINAGDERYATCNLATLIMHEEPSRAEELFGRAIAAGDEKYATNGLGILTARRDPERAASLFERACAAGDEIAAPCNLAHLLVASDPVRAVTLYEQSASHGETEALIGLAYLLRNEDRKRSCELLHRAIHDDNRDRSTRFLLKFVGYTSRTAAMDVARFLSINGFSEADETLMPLALGKAYDSTNGTVQLGTSPYDGNPIVWSIIEHDTNSALLLCNEVLATMPYCDESSTASWKSSAVRAWLNTDFKNDWLPKGCTDRLIGHGMTDDIVSCLDSHEVKRCLSRRKDLTLCKDRDTLHVTDWWVRMDEGSTLSAPYVASDGAIKWKMSFMSLGVRPALRIRLSACVSS